MRLSALSIDCPACGSKEIAYSCTPDCCFNHVCGDCLHSFQLVTRDLNETMPSASVVAEEKDTCAPTAACTRCNSLKVYGFDGEESLAGKAGCASCGALLELEFLAE